jgi:hypothetical protein
LGQEEVVETIHLPVELVQVGGVKGQETVP